MSLASSSRDVQIGGSKTERRYSIYLSDRLAARLIASPAPAIGAAKLGCDQDCIPVRDSLDVGAVLQSLVRCARCVLKVDCICTLVSGKLTGHLAVGKDT
jgi:hypothetical protein